MGKYFLLEVQELLDFAKNKQQQTSSKLLFGTLDCWVVRLLAGRLVFGWILIYGWLSCWMAGWLDGRMDAQLINLEPVAKCCVALTSPDTSITHGMLSTAPSLHLHCTIAASLVFHSTQLAKVGLLDNQQSQQSDRPGWVLGPRWILDPTLQHIGFHGWPSCEPHNTWKVPRLNSTL